MKQSFLSILALLFMLTGCTSNKPASDTEKENNTPQEIEVEKESEIEIDEGEGSGGL